MAYQKRLPKNRKTLPATPSAVPRSPSLYQQGLGTPGTMGTEVFPLFPLFPPENRIERESRESGEPVVLELALRPDGRPLSPVYWEDATGKILGPAVPESVAKTGEGSAERFWIIVIYQDMIRWIRSDRLRSKRQYDEQAPVEIVELIKEPK